MSKIKKVMEFSSLLLKAFGLGIKVFISSFKEFFVFIILIAIVNNLAKTKIDLSAFMNICILFGLAIYSYQKYKYILKK